MAIYAHFVHHLGHRVRAVLFHKVGRDVVGTFRQPPFQSHCKPNPLVLVGASWSPRIIPDDECLRNIHNFRTRGESVLHSQRIEERLYRRAHLTLALACIVIFEPAVVRTADISLDESGVGLNCHERRPEE